VVDDPPNSGNRHIRSPLGRIADSHPDVPPGVRPADVGDGYTDAACYERPDGVERHDLAAGGRLPAVVVLRVVEHRDAVVNGVLVPGRTEIRVEQPRAKPTTPGAGT
jgi:hypothetical protein